MNLEKLVAVSGKPGVYKMAANRPNGLVIEDIDTGKKVFASSRSHQFTPLESISIYTSTQDSTVEIKTLYSNMINQIDTNPPVDVKSNSNEIKTYFASVLPDFDRDKVLVSDMKKLIKWFVFLNDRGMLTITDSVEEEE